MTEMSTTRGLPFEPSQAATARQELLRQREQQKREDRREMAKYLDEIAKCYRHHTVPQDAWLRAQAS